MHQDQVGDALLGNPLERREIEGHAAIVVEDDLAEGFAARAARHGTAAQLNEVSKPFQEREELW